jgi:hypothetical protein
MLLLDSGIPDIGISFFIIGLIRHQANSFQSGKFSSDILVGHLDVGYRRQKY